MDAARILGGLLSQRGGRAPGAGNVLGQVLNGIAVHTNQQSFSDPRFAPQQHGPVENIVRTSIARHHQVGGQLPPNVSQWANQYGANYPASNYPASNVANAPIQHQHDGHCSGLGYQQRAEILVQAMILAAQADGSIDAVEQDRIVQQLQPLDPAEVNYLRQEFARPHDVHAFVHSVPQGMEYEVYQVSLMAMDLNTPHEANYMRALAQCLRIEPQVCNAIHQRCGAPTLY